MEGSGAASAVPRWRVVRTGSTSAGATSPARASSPKPPTDNWCCDGVLANHVREANYGDVRLDGLNLIGLAAFEGKVWAGEGQTSLGMFIDECADGRQRGALRTIFGGQAGRFQAQPAELIGEMRGVESVPIEFEVADELAYWRAEIPGRVVASAEALTEPPTPEGQRAQLLNPPGSEVGPGQVATWRRATADRAEGFGSRREWDGKSSKHVPFD